jgi:glutamine synthetase
MVGSSDSIGSPNIILNAIVAESFCEAADRLEAADDFDSAVHDLIKEYLTKHQRIIFNGDGYSKEWIEEAARRGLPNIPSMVESVSALTTEKATRLFEKFGIFTKAELESRAEILYEQYAKTINIEALTMVDIANKQLVPAVIQYVGMLAETVNATKAAGVESVVTSDLLKRVSGLLTAMQEARVNLSSIEKIGSVMERGKEQAFYYREKVVPAMDTLRHAADELERIVDKDYWPFPTYADLLFEV